ncbi:MAG: DMT family transporter [Pseudomonadota bacterium]|nr:DMT family transporter [Pseudomonadota bacterium]
MIEKRYRGAILASISASIGGTTVVLTRYLMPDSDPFSLPGIRYGIGDILLLIILYSLKKSKPLELIDWQPIMLLSFIFYVAFPWSFAAGLEYTTAARGAIVFTAQPVITLVVGSMIGKERITLYKVFAIIIAVTGISVTLSDDMNELAPNALLGDFLMFIAAFCNSLYVLNAGRLIEKYGSLTFTAWPMFIGSSMMLFLAVFFGQPFSGSLSFDTTQWIVLLILAIPGAALMVSLFMSSINMSTPTGITMTVGFNPLTAIILGAIILSEPVSSKILFGFVCVLTAVVLANYEK